MERLLCAGRASAYLLFLCLLLTKCASSSSSVDDDTLYDDPAEKHEQPLVFLEILSRNQAHILPNFLGYIERLDYPKDRISVWIRTDHNEDNTSAILQEWSQNVRHLYVDVDFKSSDEWLYPTFDPFDDPDERFLQITQLRQEGLDAARRAGAEYLFTVDGDVFLINNRTLSLLIEQQKPIIAPMMDPGPELTYSNFWGGQDTNGYYMRTPEYIPIVKRQKGWVGCHQVPVVHSCFLVELGGGASRRLRYWPKPKGFAGPVDDVVHFAYSAKREGLAMFVLNEEVFGHMPRPESYSNLTEAASEFVNWKLKTLVNYPPVPTSEYVSVPEKPVDTFGLDAVFMISLARRPERRNRMLACLEEFNLNYTLFDAVDGKQLNQSYLDELGIHYLPGWKDPWGERPMTFGEVGCFLSHYTIWQKMLSENLQQVLVIEDDVDFENNFRQRFQQLLEEASQFTPNWDLIYIGRKALHWQDELLVPGSTMLVQPAYSYWTLGYLISHSGAEKLVNARPFRNLLPVDEYIPIMFGVHPEKTWAAHFPQCNLETYSVFPLLAFPTHYVGDEGWFSDTEPPKEILDKIRSRKLLEKKQKQAQTLEQEKQRDKIREQAQQRVIETMRAKLKQKTEL